MKKMKKVSLLLLIICLIMPAMGAAKKPNSKFKGVQVGTITYSYREMPGKSLEDILNYTIESGISSIELMGGPVEEYAGIPSRRDGANAISEWRKTVSMDKFKEVKKMFESKGIKIHILKLGDYNWSDEELDYAFNVCRTLGAKGITIEVSDQVKRIAPIAEKHKLYIILHNHGQPGDPNFSFDHFLAYGPNVMLNFDVGHYFGATGVHPNELINRLHDRIVSIHIKDKTAKTADDPDKNRSFGKGDTPVVEILQLIRDKKWPIHCDIELEYGYPKSSNAVSEVAKCVEYCKEALMAK